MNYGVLQYNLGLKLVRSAQHSECDENWDIGDVGNEVGIAIGKMIQNMNEKDVEEFLRGVKHGISLTNGTR